MFKDTVVKRLSRIIRTGEFGTRSKTVAIDMAHQQPTAVLSGHAWRRQHRQMQRGLQEIERLNRPALLLDTLDPDNRVG